MRTSLYHYERPAAVWDEDADRRIGPHGTHRGLQRRRARSVRLVGDDAELPAGGYRGQSDRGDPFATNSLVGCTPTPARTSGQPWSSGSWSVGTVRTWPAFRAKTSSSRLRL